MRRPRKEQIGKLRKHNLHFIFFPAFTQPISQSPSQYFSTFLPFFNTKSSLTTSHTQTHRLLYRIQRTVSFSCTILTYSGEDRLISRPRYRLSWGDSSSSSVFQTSTETVPPLSHDPLFHSNLPLHLNCTVRDWSHSLPKTQRWLLPYFLCSFPSISNHIHRNRRIWIS
jgi:hypothetical protein